LPIVGKGPFTIKLTKDDGESEAPRFRISEIDGVATLTLIGQLKNYFSLIYFNLSKNLDLFMLLLKILKRKILEIMTSPFQMNLEHLTYHLKLKSKVYFKSFASFNLKENIVYLNSIIEAPPDAPQGPLDVSDVGKTSCTLMWKPPLDDGGNRVTHYIIEKKNCSKPNQNWIPYTNHCKVNHFSLIL